MFSDKYKMNNVLSVPSNGFVFLAIEVVLFVEIYCVTIARLA